MIFSFSNGITWGGGEGGTGGCSNTRVKDASGVKKERKKKKRKKKKRLPRKKKKKKKGMGLTPKIKTVVVYLKLNKRFMCLDFVLER